jgi:N-acetylglutamate synthase/N-acetylornithine aminotransferase
MSDGRAVSAAEIEAALLALAAARGPDKSIDPTEVARALAGDDPNAWGRLMGAVRRAAVRLAKEGRVTILRKGRPVDPDDFRGVYRIRMVGPRGWDD